MSKFASIIISILMAVGSGWAQAGNQVSVTHDGWTVTADGEQGKLTVTHESLGTVLEDVRLNLQVERGLGPLANWSVAKKGENQLSIRSADPVTAWLVELGPNTLKFSSTTAEAALTAQAPASKDRIVARLLDPQGAPVDWVLSDEVVNTYGGSEVRTPSSLPSRNPEVMYFALGQVSGANLHSLFDRKLDTAINFPDQTLMQRSRQDPDRLDLTIPVPGNALIRLVPDYYTKTLGVPYYVPFDDTYFRKPPMVWCSWDSCYEGVREEDIVRNVDWISAHLTPYGFEYVVLDDGYDRGRNGEHYWIEKWNQKKFPHGPKWLTDYIKSKGLRPGIWLVPNAYAGAVEEHPDWYLRFKKDGSIPLDYHTPALDSTNPAVLELLKKIFTTLDDWGFEYYKFDGEHAIAKYAPGIDLDKIYDKSIDPVVAYRNRLKLIRDTIGPQRFIEGCPAGAPLNGIGYFQSYFTGEDMYGSWQGNYAMLSSINANAFLNHIVIYTMAGEGIELIPPMTVAEAEKKRNPSVVEVARTREDPLVGFGTTLAEARTLVTYASLTGVVYSLSSVMPELPEERTRLLKMTLPSMPILPIDLFSRGNDMPLWDLFKHTTPDLYIHNYPEILDLKVNAKSGVYDVVGMTNWRSGAVTRDLAFADKLGLSAASRYVAFDYWNQKSLGVFKDRMKVEIGPHDTRVLLIHPLLNRPQLIGTSRHITGAYSISDLQWDGSRNQLRGSSESIPGETYTLFINVPEGLSVAKAGAAAKGSSEVPVHRELSGNTLSLSFPGRKEAVDWEVEFAAKAGK